MKTLEEILENVQLNSWIKNFSRAPYQQNFPHEADAELIEIDGNDSQLLAITIDSISEEITTGLYQDPFTMGWVMVMANFSDLAAVGAKPFGILISISIEPTRSDAFNEGIAQGISAACQKSGVFVLGGDTNTTDAISLTGCAIGMVFRKHKLTRIGCKPGDIVFLSGMAGLGSALGLARFAKLPGELFSESIYRPVARTLEGQFIRKYASCCMDTSDGVLATLDQLMRLNNVGFKIDDRPEAFIHPTALELCRITNIPNWMMLAGHHGEFELIFTIPEMKVEAFLQEASQINWKPLEIGAVATDQSLQILQNGEFYPFDSGKMRNLFVEMNGDIEGYIKELNKLFEL